MKDSIEDRWLRVAVKAAVLGITNPRLVKTLASIDEQVSRCLIYLGVHRDFFEPIEHDIGHDYSGELEALRRRIAAGEIHKDNIFDSEYKETIGRVLYVLDRPLDYWHSGA